MKSIEITQKLGNPSVEKKYPRSKAQKRTSKHIDKEDRRVYNNCLQLRSRAINEEIRKKKK